MKNVASNSELHNSRAALATPTYPSLADIRRIVQEIRELPPIRPLMTREQVKDTLKVSLRYVDELIADGSIPVVRLGRAVRIRPDDLDAFIESNTEQDEWPSPRSSAR